MDCKKHGKEPDAFKIKTKPLAQPANAPVPVAAPSEVVPDAHPVAQAPTAPSATTAPAQVPVAPVDVAAKFKCTFIINGKMCNREFKSEKLLIVCKI